MTEAVLPLWLEIIVAVLVLSGAGLALLGSTGLLRLGPETAFLHGAAGAPCGIMDLIRFYDPADLSRVLQTLEEAAAVSTEFTFATTIRQEPGLHRLVFCSGRSETTNSAGGVIHGTFAVARLCVELRTGTETLN